MLLFIIESCCGLKSSSFTGALSVAGTSNVTFLSEAFDSSVFFSTPKDGLVSSFFASVADPEVEFVGFLAPNENAVGLFVSLGSLGFAVVDALAPNEKPGLALSVVEDVAPGVEVGPVELAEPNEKAGFASLFSAAGVLAADVDFGAEPKLNGVSFFDSFVFVVVDPNEKAGLVDVVDFVEFWSAPALVCVDPNEKAGLVVCVADVVVVPVEDVVALFEAVPNENEGLEAGVVVVVGVVVNGVEPNEKAGFEAVEVAVGVVVAVLFEVVPNEKAGFEDSVAVFAAGVVDDPNENAGFEAAGVVDDPNAGVVVVDVAVDPNDVVGWEFVDEVPPKSDELVGFWVEPLLDEKPPNGVEFVVAPVLLFNEKLGVAADVVEPEPKENGFAPLAVEFEPKLKPDDPALFVVFPVVVLFPKLKLDAPVDGAAGVDALPKLKAGLLVLLLVLFPKRDPDVVFELEFEAPKLKPLPLLLLLLFPPTWKKF